MIRMHIGPKDIFVPKIFVSVFQIVPSENEPPIVNVVARKIYTKDGGQSFSFRFIYLLKKRLLTRYGWLRSQSDETWTLVIVHIGCVADGQKLDRFFDAVKIVILCLRFFRWSFFVINFFIFCLVLRGPHRKAYRVLNHRPFDISHSVVNPIDLCLICIC